jgi:hypothetical protein
MCERNPMRNVGDHWSAVARSVEWVSHLGTTMSVDEARALDGCADRSPLQGKLVIVGGSGLVGPGRFESAVESVFRQRPAAVALWGIGHNFQLGVERDPTTGWRKRVLKDGTTRLWPEWFADAHAVGVRDWNAGMPWVPCASAMLTAFDVLVDREPSRDFMVLNHYEKGIRTHDAIGEGRTFEHLTNNTEDLAEVLETMADARVVVTNSYHGAYWGLLLGRGVVVVEPSSTRFRGFRWPVTYADQSDWLAAVDRAQVSPMALAEARAANCEFSTRVFRMGQALGLLGADKGFDPTRGSGAWRTGADVFA